RDMRYQTAAEMRADMKRLKREIDSGRSASAAFPVESTAAVSPTDHTIAKQQSAKILRVPKFAAMIAAIILLLLGFFIYRHWFSTFEKAPTKFTQISRWNKPMLDARLSPDGHTVAFSSLAGGALQVFVMLTTGGDPLQLTSDVGDKFISSFSADGTEIYYNQFGSDETWAVPTLGGTPVRAAPGYNVQPSTDGKYFYYFRSEN